MPSFWVSCFKYTVGVEVNDHGMVIDAAPIVAKFIGQSFDSLVKWSAKFGGLIVHKYESQGEPVMGQREERSRREGRPQSTARRRAEQHESGYATKTLRLPEGVKFYKKKAGMARLTVLAYKVGKGNPFASPGETHYERTFWTYWKVGPGGDSYVCSSKTFNKADYIQEHKQREARKGADPEYLKTLNPKERQIFLVFDNDDPKSGIQLYEDAHHNFGKLLDERIKRSPESRGWDLFYLPDEDGFDLEITFAEDTTGTNNYVKAIAIDFIPRDRALPQPLAEHGYCLDEFIVETSYEKLKAAFLGEDIGGDEGSGGGDHEDYTPPERTRHTEPPKEEQKPEPPKQEPAKPKQRTAMDAGLGKGDQVYYQKNVYEIMRISGDGTSLTLIRELENGEDDIQKAIGVDQVRKATVQAESKVGRDEPASNGNAGHKDEPMASAPAGHKSDKEFDDDWN